MSIMRLQQAIPAPGTRTFVPIAPIQNAAGKSLYGVARKKVLKSNPEICAYDWTCFTFEPRAAALAFCQVPKVNDDVWVSKEKYYGVMAIAGTNCAKFEDHFAQPIGSEPM